MTYNRKKKKSCHKLTFKSTNYVHYKLITKHSLKNLCAIEQNCIRTKICQNCNKNKLSIKRWKSKWHKIWILTDPFHYFENHVKAIHIFQILTNSEYFNELRKKLLLHYKHKWEEHKWEEAQDEKEIYERF